jgi:hypothetical protein
MTKIRLVATQDRPFVRDYTHLWRLPSPLPPGSALEQRKWGLIAVLVLIAALLIGSALAASPARAETPAEAQDRLMWEHALRTDRDLHSPWGYHDYLQFYPKGKRADEARRRLREQVYRGRPDILLLPAKGRWRET